MAIAAPVCHNTSGKYIMERCEAGDVNGSGWTIVNKTDYYRHPSTSVQPAVTVSNNGTLVANKLPFSNATGNLTDPPSLNLTTTIHGGKWYEQENSPAWKSGYVHGYLAENLTGAHTQLFFWGYGNGTNDLWKNRGYACGWSALKCRAPGFDTGGKVRGEFTDGNRTGWTDRIGAQNPWSGGGNWDILIWSTVSDTVLHTHSSDHNWQYFIGFYNGYKVEGDQHYNDHGADTHYMDSWQCPSGTKEYCAGFVAGWNHAHTEDNEADY
jgi:hypothetical protein